MRLRLQPAMVLLAVTGAAGAATLGIGATGAPGGPDCARAAVAAGGTDVEPRIDCRAACASLTDLRRARARRSGPGLRLGFRRGSQPRRVTVSVFRVSRAGRVLRGRQVARFAPRRRPFRWSGRLRGRPAPSGYYVLRFRSGADTRRVPVLRRRGRFAVLAGYGSSRPCSALKALRLSSPLYGGARRRPLGIAYRVGQPGRVTVTVRSGGRVVKRFAARQRDPGTYRLRLRPRAARVGVTVSVRGSGTTARTSAQARRLR